MSSSQLSGGDATVDLASPTTTATIDGDTAEASDSGLVTGRGETIISESVVAKIAGRAAAEVDGVAAITDTGLGRLLPRARAPMARAGAVVDQGVVTLDLTLNVDYPRPVAAVTGEVRAHVTRRLSELCGMTTRRIDITVPELVTPPRPPRARVE